MNCWHNITTKYLTPNAKTEFVKKSEAEIYACLSILTGIKINESILIFEYA